MDIQTDTAVDRRRRQVAASYRRQGYRVIAPSAADAVPAFLSDCHPDIVAEKADDHVVIEVNHAHALKGSNKLARLAERVAAEPGWRLEFVAVKRPDDDVLLLAPDWLERMLQRVPPNAGDVPTAVYLVEVLTYLLRGLALRSKLRLRDKSAERVAHELAFAGAIDEASLTRIRDVLTWRNAVMRGLSLARSPAEQTIEIKKLCRDLHAQSQNPED